MLTTFAANGVLAFFWHLCHQQAHMGICMLLATCELCNVSGGLISPSATLQLARTVKFVAQASGKTRSNSHIPMQQAHSQVLQRHCQDSRQTLNKAFLTLRPLTRALLAISSTILVMRNSVPYMHICLLLCQ